MEGRSREDLEVKFDGENMRRGSETKMSRGKREDSASFLTETPRKKKAASEREGVEESNSTARSGRTGTVTQIETLIVEDQGCWCIIIAQKR